jgi:hypothetical protein
LVRRYSDAGECDLRGIRLAVLGNWRNSGAIREKEGSSEWDEPKDREITTGRSHFVIDA